MIRSFRHKGLKRLYEKGGVRGLPPQMLPRLRLILADLDAAEDLDGFFEENESWDIDSVDYH